MVVLTFSIFPTGMRSRRSAPELTPPVDKRRNKEHHTNQIDFKTRGTGQLIFTGEKLKSERIDRTNGMACNRHSIADQTSQKRGPRRKEPILTAGMGWGGAQRPSGQPAMFTDVAVGPGFFVCTQY